MLLQLTTKTWLVMTLTNNHCLHEERFATIESEIAEINARLDSKKDDIHQIQIEKDRQQELQTELIEKVTRVTVLLEEGQKQREMNNTKLADAEKKIDQLQQDVTSLSSSLNSFRNTVLALIPIISIIVGVVLHFIRI